MTLHLISGPAVMERPGATMEAKNNPIPPAENLQGHPEEPQNEVLAPPPAQGKFVL